MVQLLLEFRSTIEKEREARAEELGLTDTEFAFHGILTAEINKEKGIDAIDEKMKLQIKDVVQQLVAMMDEATEIVDFFQKWDEQNVFAEILSEQLLKNSIKNSW